MFSHALQHGLLRSEYCITLQSVPYRPSQLRCVIFPSTYLPHLPSIPSDSYGASVCLATLPDIPSLICDFCSSDQSFAIRLPSDSTSRWTPLPLAISFPLSGHYTDFHPLETCAARRILKKGRHTGMPSFSLFRFSAPSLFLPSLCPPFSVRAGGAPTAAGTIFPPILSPFRLFSF